MCSISVPATSGKDDSFSTQPYCTAWPVDMSCLIWHTKLCAHSWHCLVKAYWEMGTVSICLSCPGCFPAWNKASLALQPCYRVIYLLNPTPHLTESFLWLPLWNFILQTCILPRGRCSAVQCQSGRARVRALTQNHVLWEKRSPFRRGRQVRAGCHTML